jgi:CheY-like chemotaxis protein
MIARPFRHEAENRHLNFEVHSDPSLTRSLVTDSKRLQQVLKNLLSNAFKFTEKGGVRMSVFVAESGWTEDHPVLGRSASVVAFEVTDTGIGIPPEKQRIIFEAFQQADAGTSRKYGGTGLGLAISRELAGLLGGEIQLRSTPDEGSTFTLYLPQTYVGPSTGVAGAEAKSATIPTPGQAAAGIASKRAIEQITIADDRENLQPEDPILLIVEDDPYFATMLCDLAHDNGFKVLVATRGSEALALAHEFQPTAISLDVFLPDMLGWTVLNHFKQDPRTRHIPVQMLTLDEDRQHGLARGAFSYLIKPATSEQLKTAFARMKEYTAPRRKRLLVVEDNPAEQLSIRELLGYEDIDVEIAATGSQALAAIDEQAFDCVVLDLRLPDMSGFEILERFRDTPSLSDLPVVVFTGKDLSPEEDARLHLLARSVVVKGVESPERLLDETALFVHRVVTDLPIEKQKMLDLLHHSDEALVGKKVLVVDDDVRNIFALSSVLERRGMTVLTAGTGREAINTLESTPDVAIVLMDIMMPDMDGYETMQIIRRNPSFRRLPIIALTAKAMKGDREKCLEAGASEYLAKPVNTEQLLSALRMWFHR